jgi:general secretion pathway protein G
MSKSKGFTLIELLVVIAIIGLLASVVLASLNSARMKSRDARRIADVKQLATALELYANDNTTFPTSAGAAGATGVDFTNALVPGFEGTYIAQIPKDPIGSTNYYKYKTNAASGATSYCIGARLEGSTLPNPAVTCTTPNLTGQSVTTGAINFQVGN